MTEKQIESTKALRTLAERIEKQFDSLPAWKKGGITFDGPLPGSDSRATPSSTPEPIKNEPSST